MIWIRCCSSECSPQDKSRCILYEEVLRGISLLCTSLGMQIVYFFTYDDTYLMSLYMKGCVCYGIFLYIRHRHIPREDLIKTDIYWGLYRIHILVFVASLSIFYLIYKYASLIIFIFLYVYLITIQLCTFLLKILFYFWVKYLVVFSSLE